MRLCHRQDVPVIFCTQQLRLDQAQRSERREHVWEAFHKHLIMTVMMVMMHRKHGTTRHGVRHKTQYCCNRIFHDLYVFDGLLDIRLLRRDRHAVIGEEMFGLVMGFCLDA